MPSVVHLNKRGGTRQVRHGEQPWAWLVVTGAAARRRGQRHRHGQRHGRGLWGHRTATAARAAGAPGRGSRRDGCGQGTGRVHTAPRGPKCSEITASVFEKS